MTSMMQDVVTRGTATRAKQLGRQDLAGKTGTTNNLVDAWFAGFNPKQVAVAWIGFDQPRSLGKDETGGRAALPIWIRYMATALKGVPDVPYNVPDGVMTVKIDPTLGTLINEDEEGVYEYFYQENPPPSVEIILPAMEDPTESDFPPDNLPNNPLQPGPPELSDELPAELDVPRPSRPASAPRNQNNNSDAAANVLNPSGR
jgi:penicillin-binding protein 1A